MKRLILISLILFSLLTPVALTTHSGDVVIRTNTAHAQDAESQAYEAAATAITAPPTTTGDSSWFAQGLTWLLIKIAWIPLALTGFFVQISAFLLNLSIQKTVIEFATLFGNVNAIQDTWAVLRDLANIFFIFGLLTIAISMIVGIGNYGSRRVLATLIIVALVINFSLFFTKFVIDTSNRFALQFYNGIAVAGPDGSRDIAGAFIKDLRLDSVWDTNGVLKKVSAKGDDWTTLLITFIYATSVSIFFMVTAFVFFFASIMLLSRAAGFIMLAMLSPLAFAAFALPSTQSLTKKWWNKLWEYALFAPLLLMLFWVIARIIPGISQSFAGADLLGNFAEGATGATSAAAALINFIILITLMLGAVMLAKEFSIAGAGGLAKVGDNLGKWGSQKAGGLTLGALARLNRGTVGRGAAKFAESKFAKKIELRAPRLGGVVTRGAEKLSKSSLDVRGVLPKDVQAYTGKSVSGGYVGAVKKTAKLRQEGAKRVEKLGETAKEKVSLRKAYANSILGKTGPLQSIRRGISAVTEPSVYDASIKAAKNIEKVTKGIAGKEEKEAAQTKLKEISERIAGLERQQQAGFRKLERLEEETSSRELSTRMKARTERREVEKNIKSVARQIQEAKGEKSGLEGKVKKIEEDIKSSREAEKEFDDKKKDDKKDEGEGDKKDKD